MNIVGRGFELPAFADYLRGVEWKPMQFRPELVVIHHCAEPSLAQRPNGFEPQHMLNLKEYYEGRGWSAGPHLFVDESKVWVFTPLTLRGVHAVRFNRNGLGIEMLGDYDTEDPWSGRGLRVLTLTARVVVLLLNRLGLNESAIRFHRDDPTTAKTCPGTKIGKDQFLKFVGQVAAGEAPTA